MSDVLKFDLYKIAKSKTFRVFWILPALFTLLTPLINYVINKQIYESVMQHLRASGDMMVPVIVFACLFACKDYSSGYVKNLYGNVNSVEYTLSKVVCIALFCIAYVIVEFLADLIFNLIFGAGVIYNYESDAEYFLISGFFLSRLTYILRGVTVGTFVLFLSSLIKKEYVVVVLVLVYLLFFNQYVNTLLEKLATATGISFEKYTIFCGARHQGWFGDGVFSNLLLPHIIFPLFYIVIFTLFSWLLLKKKNVYSLQGDDMLSSILKFDLYKTVKSKGFITCWIIAILFCLMQPMSIYLSGGDNDSVIRNLSFSRALDLAVIVFACLLWSKDYSSGYIKNVYCIVDKWKYVLSKFICLVLFCIAYVIMEFLFELFFNYVFGAGVFNNAEYGCTIWHFLIKTCAYILLGLKVGTFCFFLSNCCKSGIATIVIVLVYYAFLGYQVRNLIDSLINLIFPSNEFSIVTYSIFGGTVDAVGYSIDGVFNTWRMVFERKILPDFIVQSLYIVLFTVCNYLLMKKRNV